MVTRTRQLARAAFISGVAALAICAGGAHAQDMGANGEQADDASGGLGVIVVTAQRRTENLNDVGMSVATASGDELRDQGVADDVARLEQGEADAVDLAQDLHDVLEPR